MLMFCIDLIQTSYITVYIHIRALLFTFTIRTVELVLNTNIPDLFIGKSKAFNKTYSNGEMSMHSAS